jgi:hypothetical protein
VISIADIMISLGPELFLLSILNKQNMK